MAVIHDMFVIARASNAPYIACSMARRRSAAVENVVQEKCVRVLLSLLFCVMCARAQEAAPRAATAVVTLSDESVGAWRWLDVADQEYAAGYQSSYTYSSATVQIEYETTGSRLRGTLTASGLKPNFACQLKLLGAAGSTSNDLIGRTGRWWQEEWNGTAWANGMNLNDKGDGSSPNPNDLVYESRKDEVDATSPTGLRYKYTAYRVFDYFITDEQGNATVDFVCEASYHVLWKESQRTPSSNDGSSIEHSFDVEPLSHTQYDTDYDTATVRIFGEWERLPIDDVPLLEGTYDCQIVLTEESFHSSGIGGSWALAMTGNISFTIYSDADWKPDIAVSGTTAFGSVAVGSSASETFTISNGDVGDLELSGSPHVQIVSGDTGDFTITTQPSSPIFSGNSSDFTVRFAPTTYGSRSAVLEIASNDPDTPNDQITVTGAGLAADLEVTGDTGFPYTGLGQSTEQTFTITNNGNSTLTLNGTPLVEITGAHATDYTVTSQPATSSLTTGASTTFTVQFTPTTYDLRSATLQIASNDPDSPSLTAVSGICPIPDDDDGCQLNTPGGMGKALALLVTLAFLFKAKCGVKESDDTTC